MKLFVRVLASLALLGLVANGVLTLAISGGSEETQRVEYWLSTHPEPQRNVEELQRLSVRYRKLILQRLVPAQRAAVWQAHLQTYRARGVLPETLFQRAAALLVESNFSSIPPEVVLVSADRLLGDSLRELGRDLTGELFIALGPPTGNPPAASAVLAVRSLIRSAVGLHASVMPDCNCCTGCTWTCDVAGPQVCVGTTCVWEPGMSGCGFGGYTPCNGECTILPGR